MKLTKSLKYTIIITVGILVATAAIIVRGEFHFSVDYSEVIEAEIRYGQEVEVDDLVKKIEDVQEFERIEILSKGHYKVSFLELTGKDNQEIREKLSEIEGLNSYKTIKKTSLPLVVSWRVFAVFLFVFYSVIGIFCYQILNEVKLSRNRVGTAIATLWQIIFLTLINFALLSVISIFRPLTQELFILAGFMIMSSILLSLITLVRFNLYLDEEPQTKFGKLLIDFAEKYDESYVVHGLLVLLLVFPFVVVSTYSQYVFILMIGMVLSNIYAQTYGFVHFFAFWNLLINKLPIIKQLKWVRKES